MGAAVYPQDIPGFYLRELDRRVHSCGQITEGRVAELIRKRDAPRANAGDPACRPAVPLIIWMRFVGPGRPFHIPVLLAKGDQDIVDFLRAGDRLLRASLRYDGHTQAQR